MLSIVSHTSLDSVGFIPIFEKLAELRSNGIARTVTSSHRLIRTKYLYGIGGYVLFLHIPSLDLQHEK